LCIHAANLQKTLNSTVAALHEGVPITEIGGRKKKYGGHTPPTPPQLPKIPTKPLGWALARLAKQYGGGGVWGSYMQLNIIEMRFSC
jgi:hypothetical protein